MSEVFATALAYPVLCLALDGSVSVARDVRELSSCNAHAYYRKRYFAGLTVIDSNAASFTVTAAHVDPPLGRLRELVTKLLNRHLLVSLALQPAGPPSLPDAKRRLTEWLDRAPDHWEASEELAVWKRRVSEAKSMSSLIHLFA